MWRTTATSFIATETAIALLLPILICQSPSAFAIENVAIAQQAPDALAQKQQLLTLEQAVLIALREQPKIAAQLARLDKDRSLVERERSRLLPYIQAGGVGNLGPTVINGFNGLFVAASRGNFGFDVNARMTVFDFGANLHRLKASKVDVLRSQHDFQTQRAETILNAKLAYFKVLSTLELKRIAEKDVENRTLVARFTKEMFETGLKSKLDWQQAEVDLAQSQQGLQDAEKQVQLAFNALNFSMGQNPEKRYQLLESELPALPTESVAAQLEEGKRFRPCLIAAVKNVEAAGERVVVAKREFLPKVDVIGAGGYLDDSAILQGNQNRYGSGAIIAYAPLFTGGRLEADLKAARASEREALADHHDMELRIAREIVDAFESLKTTYAKYQISQKQVAFARQTYEYATERYKAGLGFYLEVSAAETLLINALAEMTRNKFEYAGIDAVLRYARGKDYLAYKN